MTGQAINGPSGEQYLPVVAVPDGAGGYKLELLRTGQPQDMTYPGSTVAGDYHDVRGVTTWPALLKGNSIMVSKGTVNDSGGNPGPLAPEAIQVGQAQTIGRIGTGDLQSLTIGLLQAQSSSSLTDFYDVEGLDDQAHGVDYVLAVSSIATPSSPVEDRFVWKQFTGSGVSVGATAPSENTLWIYTDGSTIAPTDVYYYDPRRAKWLSTAVYTMDCYNTSSLTSDAYMSWNAQGGAAMSATAGYPVDDALVMVGVDATIIDSTSGTANFQLAAYLGGTGGTQVAAVAIDSTSAGVVQKTGQNFTVTPASGGEVLSFAQANAASAVSAYYRVHFRKTRS